MARRVVRRFAGEVLAQHVRERAVMNTWVSTRTKRRPQQHQRVKRASPTATRTRSRTRIGTRTRTKPSSRVGMSVMNCADNTDAKKLSIMTEKGIEGRLNKITVTRFDVMCLCFVKKGKLRKKVCPW